MDHYSRIKRWYVALTGAGDHKKITRNKDVLEGIAKPYRDQADKARVEVQRLMEAVEKKSMSPGDKNIWNLLKTTTICNTLRDAEHQMDEILGVVMEYKQQLHREPKLVEEANAKTLVSTREYIDKVLKYINGCIAQVQAKKKAYACWK